MITGNRFAWGFYPLFDCFVLPSQAEGLSIALLEAMSFGLPCITTAQKGGHPVIAHGVNGLLMRPDNAQDLAHLVNQLLTDSSLQSRVGEQAFHEIKTHYSHLCMARKYREYFEEVALPMHCLGKR